MRFPQWWALALSTLGSVRNLTFLTQSCHASDPLTHRSSRNLLLNFWRQGNTSYTLTFNWKMIRNSLTREDRTPCNASSPNPLVFPVETCTSLIIIKTFSHSHSVMFFFVYRSLEIPLFIKQTITVPPVHKFGSRARRSGFFLCLCVSIRISDFLPQSKELHLSWAGEISCVYLCVCSNMFVNKYTNIHTPRCVCVYLSVSEWV